MVDAQLAGHLRDGAVTAAGEPTARCQNSGGYCEGRDTRDNLSELKPQDQGVRSAGVTSNTERTQALADFLHTYNHHRCHTALGGQPPISRVNDAAGQYS